MNGCSNISFTRTNGIEYIDAKHVARQMKEVVGDEPKEFAYHVGLSLSAVYNYMNGRIPTTDILYRIARYTKRPMEWFLDPRCDEKVVEDQISIPNHRQNGYEPQAPFG